MRHLLRAVVAAWLLAPVSAGAQERWVRGTVSAVAGDSIAVKTADGEMKFAVNAKTAVVARGAGSAAQAAEDEGKTGVKLAELVKSGERVEVHYTGAAGAMTATRIRVGITGGDATGGGERGRSAFGTVAAVTGSSLTVTVGGKEMRFALDSGTRFIGRGLGTKAKAAGGKLAPTDAVTKGDQVTVSYREQGGAMNATEVRVVR
jgi:hypothetical protein